MEKTTQKIESLNEKIDVIREQQVELRNLMTKVLNRDRGGRSGME